MKKIMSPIKNLIKNNYKYTLRDEIMGIDEEVDTLYNKYTISLFFIIALLAIIFIQSNPDLINF